MAVLDFCLSLADLNFSSLVVADFYMLLILVNLSHYVEELHVFKLIALSFPVIKS